MLRSSTVSTLLRFGLPPLPHHTFVVAASPSRFYSIAMTSLVPIYRLIQCPANLTPDDAQPVVRYRLYSIAGANVTTCFYHHLAISRLRHWFTHVQLI